MAYNRRCLGNSPCRPDPYWFIAKANKHFAPILVCNEEIPAWHVKREIWGEERTCVVVISKQLKEGQIRGIHQHLEKKYKALEALKRRLENKKRRTELNAEEIQKRLSKIIKGQFSEEIIMAYRGQAKIEYAFRTIKNPYHMEAKEKAGYEKGIDRFMEDLNQIRLACQIKKKSRKVKYQLETIPKDLKKNYQSARRH